MRKLLLSILLAFFLLPGTAEAATPSNTNAAVLPGNLLFSDGGMSSAYLYGPWVKSVEVSGNTLTLHYQDANSAAQTLSYTPTDAMLASAAFNSGTKILTLTLSTGGTVDVSLAELRTTAQVASQITAALGPYARTGDLPSENELVPLAGTAGHILTKTIDGRAWTVSPGAVPENRKVPDGGTAGQILAKQSSANYDADWVTPTGEENVQVDWTESNQTSDAFIRHKPSLATVATSGSYNDLTNKPTFFSGSYNDLTNKPTLFSGAYNDLSGKPTLFSGSYNDLTNKPSIPSPISDDSVLDLAETSRSPSDRGKFLGVSASNENDLVLLTPTSSSGGLSQEQVDARIATYARAMPSGTIPDAQIPSGITRDSELPGAITSAIPENRRIPSGGTSGQVLSKASNANYATSWITVSPGTNVVANPTGTRSALLEGLRVGSTSYWLPADVEGNPSAAASAALTKLKVGPFVFSVGGLSGDQAAKLNRQQDNPLSTPAARTGPWRTLGSYVYAPYSSSVWDANTLAEGAIMPGTLSSGQRAWQIHLEALDLNEAPGVLTDLTAVRSVVKILDADGSEIYEGTLVADSVAERATGIYLFNSTQASFAAPSAGDRLIVTIQSEIDAMLGRLKRGELDDDVLTYAKILAGSAAEKAGWRNKIGASHVSAGNALPALAEHNLGDVFILGADIASGISYVDISDPGAPLTSAAAGDVMLVLPTRSGTVWTRVGTILGINSRVQAALDMKADGTDLEAEEVTRATADVRLGVQISDLRAFIGNQQMRIDPPYVANVSALARNYTLHIQSLQGIPDTAKKVIVSIGGAHESPDSPTARDGNFVIAWDNAWVRTRTEIPLTRLISATLQNALGGGWITEADHSLPVHIGFYPDSFPSNAHQQSTDALAYFSTSILIGEASGFAADFTIADKTKLDRLKERFETDLGPSPVTLPVGTYEINLSARISGGQDYISKRILLSTIPETNRTWGLRALSGGNSVKITLRYTQATRVLTYSLSGVHASSQTTIKAIGEN